MKIKKEKHSGEFAGKFAPLYPIIEERNKTRFSNGGRCLQVLVDAESVFGLVLEVKPTRLPVNRTNGSKTMAFEAFTREFERPPRSRLSLTMLSLTCFPCNTRQRYWSDKHRIRFNPLSPCSNSPCSKICAKNKC